METISMDGTIAGIGLVITAIGWFVSARLSDRSQKLLLICNLLNEARRDITASIRQAIDWLIDLQGAGSALLGYPGSMSRK